MNKEKIVKSKNLFDEEKIIDTGMKEPLFIRMPFDEYRKLQEENETLKENNLFYQEELAKVWKENEELKIDIDILKTDIDEHNIIYTDTPEFEENFISKDKIRTKIKELEKHKEKEEYIDEYGVRNIPVLNGLIDLKIEALKELLGDDE